MNIFRTKDVSLGKTELLPSSEIMGFNSPGNWSHGGNRYLYHYRNSWWPH